MLAVRSLLTLVDVVMPVAMILVRSLVTLMSEGNVRMTLHPLSIGRPMSKVKIPEES